MAARQGVEMQRVDEEEAPKEKEVEWDWDTQCSYMTFKIVRVRDRYLGCVYWSIVTAVIMYISIIIFNIEGRHKQFAPGLGTVITRFKGKAFANGKVFDDADLRFPAIEPNGAFILTKRITMPDQTIGRCVDQDFPRNCPCLKDEACIGAGTPPGFGGRCESQGWCPSLGDLNAAKPPPGAVIDRMEGLEHSILQIMVGIAFPSISEHFFIAGASEEGTQLYKNITLGEVLALADTGALTIEDILDTGALIGISFSWSCDVEYTCEPLISVKWLDAGAGFVQKRSRHRGLVNGADTRDAMYMYGIRLIVDSAGIGRKTSPVLIVVQTGSCIALLRLASIITDFVMLQYGDQKRKNAYYKCKVQQTEDFSDLQDRINLIKEEREKQQAQNAPQQLGRSSPNTGTSGAGAAVNFGLGAGQRGGNATILMRGRNTAAA